jgi:chromosome segregation ATPase
MSNSTDQTKSVPTWGDFLKADKEYSDLQQASDLARSRQRDCEEAIRSNDMRLEMLKFVHDILESKKTDFECMSREDEEIAQKFVGQSYTLEVRNEQLFDYCQEIDEQKYALHLAIADATVKRQQYKEEADNAEEALKPIRRELAVKHNKLEAEAKEAAAKKQQEESK